MNCIYFYYYRDESVYIDNDNDEDNIISENDKLNNDFSNYYYRFKYNYKNVYFFIQLDCIRKRIKYWN